MLNPVEVEALVLSLKVAALAVAVSAPVGIAVAYVLARLDFPGKILVDAVVHTPLVVPPVVVGYLLLLGFARTGPIGAWLHDVFGVSIAFTWQGAAVASGIMAFPLLVRAVRLSLEAADPGLEDAARTLGAGRSRVFLTITLPLALPGIVTGMVLAFARSLGEFGATITFVSNIPGETQTLPLALFSLSQIPGSEAAAARLAVLSVIVAVLALIASEVLARRVRRQTGQIAGDGA